MAKEQSLTDIMGRDDILKKVVELKYKGVSYAEIAEHVKREYGVSLFEHEISKLYDAGIKTMATVMGMDEKLNDQYKAAVVKSLHNIELATQVLWNMLSELEKNPDKDPKDVIYTLREVRNQNKDLRDMLQDLQQKVDVSQMNQVMLTHTLKGMLEQLEKDGIIRIIKHEAVGLPKTINVQEGI